MTEWQEYRQSLPWWKRWVVAKRPVCFRAHGSFCRRPCFPDGVGCDHPPKEASPPPARPVPSFGAVGVIDMFTAILDPIRSVDRNRLRAAATVLMSEARGEAFQAVGEMLKRAVDWLEMQEEKS